MLGWSGRWLFNHADRNLQYFRISTTMPQLAIVSGEVVSAARSILLTEGRVFVIGRSFACDLCVPEAYVARRQCDIEVRNGTVWLLDYGSIRGERFSNSVLVNGRPVSSIKSCDARVPSDTGLIWHLLQSGDKIRVGTAVFRLETSLEPKMGTSGHVENFR